MEIYTQTRNLNNQLETIEFQIDKTVSDIGRLSSYHQNPTQIMIRIRNEKLRFLHLLREKKNLLIDRMG